MLLLLSLEVTLLDSISSNDLSSRKVEVSFRGFIYDHIHMIYGSHFNMRVHIHMYILIGNVAVESVAFRRELPQNVHKHRPQHILQGSCSRTIWEIVLKHRNTLKDSNVVRNGGK